MGIAFIVCGMIVGAIWNGLYPYVGLNFVVAGIIFVLGMIPGLGLLFAPLFGRYFKEEEEIKQQLERVAQPPKCPECGKETSEGKAEFCPFCGASMETKTTQKV